MKVSLSSFRIVVATILSASSLLISPVHAADVVWGEPQNISGAGDVSTSGNLIGAFNVGDVAVPSTTVNSVPFQSFAAPGGNGTVGNFSTTSGFSFADNTAAGSANAPFSNLSPAYQTLLMSRVAMLSPLTLSMSGLIVGAQYQFQWWCNSSAGSFGYDTTAIAGNSVTLQGNVNSMDGGLGQFAIGSFIADATTQTIVFNFGEVGYLNAFQLRQIPTTTVPESGSTLGLLALALGTVFTCQRRFVRARAA